MKRISAVDAARIRVSFQRWLDDNCDDGELDVFVSSGKALDEVDVRADGIIIELWDSDDGYKLGQNWHGELSLEGLIDEWTERVRRLTRKEDPE